MPCDITSMWNLKYDTNELIYETETDSHTQRRLFIAKGRRVGEGWTGSLGLLDANYDRMEKQRGPTAQHRELYSLYPVINHNGKEYEK